MHLIQLNGPSSPRWYCRIYYNLCNYLLISLCNIHWHFHNLYFKLSLVYGSIARSSQVGKKPSLFCTLLWNITWNIYMYLIFIEISPNKLTQFASISCGQSLTEVWVSRSSCWPLRHVSTSYQKHKLECLVHHVSRLFRVHNTDTCNLFRTK